MQEKIKNTLNGTSVRVAALYLFLANLFFITSCDKYPVTGRPIAEFELSPDSIVENNVCTLTDISQGTIQTWNWDMGDGNKQTGKIVYHTYSQSGDYKIFLEVTDTNGYIDTISKTVHVYEELDIYLPQMFTPNGDGIDDTWKPVMLYYSKSGYELSIFDRWGQQIFYTADTEAAWNGTVNGQVTSGVYYCIVIVRNFAGKEYEFVGAVTVIG